MSAHPVLTALTVCAGAAVFGNYSSVAQDVLFESHRLTEPGEFTSGIEGPAVSASNVLYVANFQKSGTIGSLRQPSTKFELIAKLPRGSVGNGIRFDREGRMFVADYAKHNVFVFERDGNGPKIYFHSTKFNQPNDLAISADGTLYASDPSFRRGKGQIWRITRGPDGRGHGSIMASERKMGTTNGIDLSPDGETLYVSESQTRELWAYRIEKSKLVDPRLMKKFSDGELDGLRTDIDGNIFVTRPAKGLVAMLAASGDLLREIRLTGRNPTNITFGGTDAKTVFVTQADGRYIEQFRVEVPGREPCLQRVATACGAEP